MVEIYQQMEEGFLLWLHLQTVESRRLTTIWEFKSQEDAIKAIKILGDEVKELFK